jgi:hypothetical protein
MPASPSAGKAITRSEGDAFVFIDSATARITTIIGYPTLRLAQLG